MTSNVACPSFPEDSNRGVYYSASGWTLQSLAMAVVGVRLYSRVLLTRSAGSDDVAIVIATLICLAGQVGDELAVHAGLGRHCHFLSRAQLSTALKWLYIDWEIAFVAFFFTRLSVMLFTLRLLPRTKVRSQWVIYAAFILNFAITMIGLVSYGVRCQPMSALWQDDPGSKCVSTNVLSATMQVNGALSCVTDVVTAMIPAFLLWNVQMKRSTKAVLNIIFLLGLFDAALSIGRAATTSYTSFDPDSTWVILPPNTFSIVESKLGIIFASCPALRQMVSYYRRTHTIFPSVSRQAPNADFQSMRHRVRLRDVLWRGERDSSRAQGLLNAHTSRDKSKDNLTDYRPSGEIGPDDSPLTVFEHRIVDSVSHV